MSKLDLKTKVIAIFLLLFCCVSVLTYAAILDDVGSSSELMIIIGETKTLSVRNPRKVKIGNPRFLDVVGAGRSELLLSGLEEGETLLTIVDDFGQHLYNVKIYREDLEKLQERIDSLLATAGFGQLKTKLGDKERKIFIIGKLPTSKKDYFEGRIETVKDKIINLIEYQEDVPSVQIDVEVLEISKTAMDEIGFEWEKSTTLGNSRLTDFLSPSHALRVLKSPWDQDTWSVTLNFLKQRNEARTLSRPKIVCLSGKEATLNVGGERPYVTGKTTSNTESGITITYQVEQKNYGLTLRIQPTVMENDEVKVSLRTEIIEIDESVSVDIDEFPVPGSTETSSETELTVLSGQTVFMAGLMKSKVTDVKDGISGLSNIPFIGALFRNKDYDKIDSEIVITLTPNIIRNQPVSYETTPQIVTTSHISVESQAMESAERRLEDDNDPVFHYSSLVQDIINSNIKYPQELEGESFEGAVKLSLHLLSTGELSGVIIMQSSGNALIDESAEYSVRRLSPFPAFPSEIKLKELWIDVPIVYKK